MDIPVTDGLEDRVAIVTGAGARDDGIGNGRAERTVAMIEAAGYTALAQAADVTQLGDCEAMVNAALSAWGRVDVLDNNVGIGIRGSVVDEDY